MLKPSHFSFAYLLGLEQKDYEEVARVVMREDLKAQALEWLEKENITRSPLTKSSYGGSSYRIRTDPDVNLGILGGG